MVDAAGPSYEKVTAIVAAVIALTVVLIHVSEQRRPEIRASVRYQSHNVSLQALVRPPTTAGAAFPEVDPNANAAVEFSVNASQYPAAVNSTGDVADVEDADGPPSRSASHSGSLKDHAGRIVNPVRSMDPVNATLFSCPRFRVLGDDADKKKAEKHVSKYNRYAADYCNSTGLMQMNIPADVHLNVLSTIAKLVRLKPNDIVLDWGSGCGTMLNYFHLQYNTTGVGLDITEGAVKFAWSHSQPRQTFCWMDGSDMSLFPSSTFDAVVSWGAVYHVRRTQVQCDIIRHFVRILKPGGIAFVGHVRTDKSQDYWKRNKCAVGNAGIVRLRDFRTFRMSAWKRNGFFSLVVSKNMF